ncbi:MAG: tRNA uridine-5-carboxymethylaminomethyl(34) synthesis GTPase MnmE [Burkholderiales bacterium]|nr:MAG: tRNA uridine-5-carboxymethylaminomethyl(34) synthesis GTPase MnmE [Burkholderiales bacterium]
MLSASDTIAAIATPPGRGGVGIVRVSGPGARQMMRAITQHEFAPREAHVARFLAGDGAVIDRGLVLFFCAPASFTGEDVLELHAHGGPALLRLLLERCLALGARPARPGEFTERAYLNAKLDLAQAESVADLIQASTTTAVRAAARNLEGALSEEVQALGQALSELRALVEAAIDFPNEEGVELVPEARLATALVDLGARLERLLATAAQGRLLREGLHIVLVGAPNVGKSSLMNRFAGREVAIVTPVPGTTRDALRESLEIDGVPLHLIDTAGLRESADEVEILGMERTRRALGSADLALAVVAPPGGRQELPALLAELPADLPYLVVHNKIDLDGCPAGWREVDGGREISVSAKTGAGIEVLGQAILELGGWRAEGGETMMASARHLDALGRTQVALHAAAGVIGARELFAEELRQAEAALGEIRGKTLPDDLLGLIFQRFCIGK